MSVLFKIIVNLSENFDFYSSKCENFVVIGDFNAEMTIYASYNLKNLIKQPPCSKNLENPTRNDHILTNHPSVLSSVFETGLCDFRKLKITVLKVFHVKHKPKIIQYRDFNYFDNASFRAYFLQELSLQNVHPGEFGKFEYISSKVVNTYAPIKEKTY